VSARTDDFRTWRESLVRLITNRQERETQIEIGIALLDTTIIGLTLEGAAVYTRTMLEISPDED
jgi:hypothetical protein